MTALRAPAPSPDTAPGSTGAPPPPAHRPAAGLLQAGRVPSMDGFRALAVLWVFLVHAWILSGRGPIDHGLLRTLAAEGYLGMDVLFIVSGFVLFLPAAMNGGSIGSIRFWIAMARNSSPRFRAWGRSFP